MNYSLAIFDNTKNYKYNLSTDQELFQLWNDYENFKINTSKYNEVITALFVEVSQLKLIQNDKVNEKKYHYIPDSVLQIYGRKEVEQDSGLSLINKLLSIKLRSLRLEQKLYEENHYLKILASKLDKFLLLRKQLLLKKINQSIQDLAKPETKFTTKIKQLFMKLYNTSKSVDSNSGYLNISSKETSKKKLFMQKDLSFDFDYYLLMNNQYHNNSNLILAELLSNKIHDLLKVKTRRQYDLFEVELTTNNMRVNTKESDYPKLNKNHRNQIKYDKMNNVDEKSIVRFTPNIYIPKLIDIKSRFESIKKLFDTANEVIGLQSKRIHFYSDIVNYGKNYDFPNVSSNEVCTINSDQDSNLDLVNNEQINSHKSTRESDNISNTDKIKEILKDYQNLKMKALKTFLNISQLYLPEINDIEKIEEPVRPIIKNQDVPTINNLVKAIESDHSLYVITNEKTSFIKEPEQYNLYTKSKRKKFKKNTFDVYNKNYKINKLPEMGQIYQIILQNKVPGRVNFQFLKSNEQIFVINASSTTNLT